VDVAEKRRERCTRARAEQGQMTARRSLAQRSTGGCGHQHVAEIVEVDAQYTFDFASRA
jgi:hypothetical protein